MGLETQIRLLCRDVLVPQAWSTKTEIHEGQVLIDDTLIRLMSWTHIYNEWTENKYGNLSGEEFFELVWEPVQTFLTKEESRAYVLCIDDKVNVLSKNLKKRVHSERAHAKNQSVALKNKKYADAADEESKLT